MAPHNRVAPWQVAWDIRRLANELGRTPTTEDYRERGEHAEMTAVHKFSSWSNACRAAGLEPNARGGGLDAPPEDEMRRLYSEEGLSVRGVAAELGVSHMTAHSWLRAAGVL